jgi:periplasmic protein TonB
MFEDSLLESGGKLKTKRGDNQLHRSFLEIGIDYCDGSDAADLYRSLAQGATHGLPDGTPATATTATTAGSGRACGEADSDRYGEWPAAQPTKIPQKVQMIKEDEAPPQMASAGVVGGVPGGIPGGQMGGVIGGIINSTPVAVPTVATPQRVRVSQGVSTGLLVRKVNPTIRRWRGRRAFRERWFCRREISKMVPSKTCTWSADIQCWLPRRSTP